MEVDYEARVQRGGLLRFRLIVANHGDRPIWRVTFPDLPRLNGGPGQRVAIPYSTGWSLDPDRLHDGERIVLNYPVHAAMQWMELYTANAGLYVGVHDEVPVLKELLICRDEAGAHLAWRFPDLLLQPGERVELPPVLLAAHDEDWRAGAGFYRDWAKHVYRFAEPVDWFARRPAWAWIGMRGQHAPKVDRRFDELPAVARELREHGIPVPHVAGYMEHGHDTHFPDYIAGDAQGGEAALRTAVRQIHREGGRLALYTNGRLIDPEGSFGRIPDWQQHTVVLSPCAKQSVFERSGTFTEPKAWDREGRLAKEKYTNVTFAIGCPSDPVWQRTFAERLIYLVEEYDIDGIYIDQVCGCSSLPCYSGQHGHAKPNLAWAGYRTLLSDLREAIRKRNPDCYLATEGMTDVFGQFFDVQQAHNDWVHQVLNRADPLPEMYRLTFPESLAAIGPVSANEERYVRLAHSVMAGFDLFPVTRGNTDAVFRHRLRQVIDRRAALDTRIRGAAALPWLEIDSDGYRGLALASDRHVVIQAAWCSEEKERSLPERVRFRLRQAPEVSDGVVWIDGVEAPLAFESSNGEIRFDLPGTDLVSVVFSR